MNHVKLKKITLVTIQKVMADTVVENVIPGYVQHIEQQKMVEKR